jgi:4-hydroxybenzoate polyprenyltransferase
MTTTAATRSRARRLGVWAELTRVGNLPTVWTNVLAGVVLSGAAFQPGRALGALVAVSLLYLGGMSLNDLLDVEEDRARRPQRPLPSGRISPLAAGGLTAALFAAALALLAASAGGAAFAVGLALLGAIVAYDVWHRRSPWTVLLMATCRALVYPVAALATGGTVGGAVTVAAVAQFAWIVALSLAARAEKAGARVPPIPWLLAGIALVDGLVLAIAAHPAWLLAGVAGAAATRLAQTRVRGD